MSRLLIGFVSRAVTGSEYGTGLLYGYNSILIYASALFLFLAFCQMRIRNKWFIKIVTALGPLSFGAYLWSDHPLIRSPLWDFVDMPGKTGGGVLAVFGYLLFVTGVVFIIGCVIEWVRVWLMGLLGLEKLLKKIDMVVRKKV